MKAETKAEYGYSRRVALDYGAATARVRETLAGEGFGVLSEIDMQAKLKEKLGVDFMRYVILGACNPALANQALGADPGIGLLLPCNVVVFEDSEGVVVAAIDAERLLSVTGRDDLAPLAKTVNEKLRRAIDAV